MSGMTDVLEIGVPFRFTKIAPNKALSVIQSEFEAKGIAAQLTYWTDPANANPALGCKFTYVMRCDGMSEAEIEITKGEHAATKDSFVFDPMAWSKTLPANTLDKMLSRPHRQSHTGWEDLMVGGPGQMVKLYMQALKFRLGVAMLKRGHNWVFKCERMRMFDEPGKNTAPWWLVTRIK